MNIKKLIQSTLKRTKLPPLEIEIILAHILKKSREFLLAHPEKQLTKTQISNFKFQISRRAKGEPIAYITGHKQFYGLDFHVNKNVLVPRPETELMVEEALRITHNVERITLIDIGSGSGCIIITLAKLLKKNLKANKRLFAFKFFATDISRPALTIACKNAKLHNVHKKIKFLHGSLLEPIIKKSKSLEIRNYNLEGEQTFVRLLNNSKYLNNPNNPIIITANLPYLTTAQIKNSPTIQHEPKLALSAGPDGLKYYKQLFKQIKRFTIYDCPGRDTRSGASRLQILIEIDPSQVKKIKQIIKKELPDSQIQIKKDLAGRNRLIVITILGITRLNTN